MSKEFIITAIGTAIGLGYLVYENKKLVISEFNINSSKIPKNFKGFKIVHLTDLHGNVFGNNNEILIDKIKKIKPDIIVATGDMISASLDKSNVFLNLCTELKKISSIYYSLGNHESSIYEYENSIDKRVDNINWYNNYIKSLKKIGVVILDNAYVSIIRGNEKINIYGLTMPLGCYKRKFSNGLRNKEQLTSEYIEKLIGKNNKDIFSILLAHNPLEFPVYSKWGSDLIFSGHVHGGIIRLPFIKGVLSPEVAFFPNIKKDIIRYEIVK